MSYDPAYWYESVTPHFVMKEQIKVRLLGARYYFDLFFHQLGVLIVGVLILYRIGQRRPLPELNVLRS